MKIKHRHRPSVLPHQISRQRDSSSQSPHVLQQLHRHPGLLKPSPDTWVWVMYRSIYVVEWLIPLVHFHFSFYHCGGYTVSRSQSIMDPIGFNQNILSYHLFWESGKYFRTSTYIRKLRYAGILYSPHRRHEPILVAYKTLTKSSPFVKFVILKLVWTTNLTNI